MQARNFTTNVPKILDLKSSSEQIFPRKLSLGAPATFTARQRKGNVFAMKSPENRAVPTRIDWLQRLRVRIGQKALQKIYLGAPF